MADSQDVPADKQAELDALAEAIGNRNESENSEGADTPAKKPARKRTPRNTASKRTGTAHEGAAESVAESLAERQDNQSDDDAPKDTPNNEAPEGDTEPAPGFPAAFLLFQEPDPTAAVRTRKRREPRKDEAEAETQGEDSAETAKDEKKGKAKSSQNSKKGRGAKGGKKSQANEEAESASTRESTDTDDAAGDSSDEASSSNGRSRTRTRSRSNRAQSESSNDNSDTAQGDEDSTGTTRRRRRRRSSNGDSNPADEVTALKGSTRLEAKRQRRRDGRDTGRRRTSISESEFLARRESVARTMLVREQNGLNQIAVLEDGILVEHYVARHTQVSMVGNVYLGRVQNVLPSMEAAFVDIGKGRNAVLYAGEVNWEAAGMDGKPRRIEQALKSGDAVLVQVTKDPIGHKGARLTAQITLAGRHLVLVPSGAMTGISRKLPERERNRLKKLLREIVPEEHGVIVRTAAEGATEEQLRADVDRLTKYWADIQEKSKKTKAAPTLLKGEPELAVRVVRDVFNEDFEALHVQGKGTFGTIKEYVHDLSPELDDRVHQWVNNKDIFSEHRVDEQLAKAMDRKVYLPSGGSLVIDRTEAMTVVDVNTGKFTGAGGTLEETVTKNNLEAAEEIVRQLRLRDIGGIIVVDFIDMVLESNRDLVLRRLIECLGRDRTRHQVAEVTSLGLVQMTRKRVGQGLVEAFSSTCEHCEGKGFITHDAPVEKNDGPSNKNSTPNRRGRGGNNGQSSDDSNGSQGNSGGRRDERADEARAAVASIAAAAHVHDAGDAKADKPAETSEAEKPAESSKPAATPEADKPAEKPKQRRAVSSGPIKPKSSSGMGIMTFPANPPALPAGKSGEGEDSE